MIYVVIKIRGKILQLSTALAKCINLTYGLGPKSLTLVSTSKSSLTLRVVLSSVATTTASGVVSTDHLISTI